MSGIAKGVGKVFKKVAPAALMLGVGALAGGAMLGAGGAMAGAAPLTATLSTSGTAAAAGGSLAAGAAGAATAGQMMAPALSTAMSAAPAAAAATGAAAGGGFLSNLFGQGGTLGRIMQSPVFGNIVSGVGEGIATKMALDDVERQEIDAERRREARYEGVGEASDIFSTAPRPVSATPDTPRPQRGFAVASQPSQPAQPGKVGRPDPRPAMAPRRPGVADLQRSAKKSGPRIRYNRDTGRIEQVD